jgi:putative CocE/NonD family hydrolase
VPDLTRREFALAMGGVLLTAARIRVAGAPTTYYLHRSGALSLSRAPEDFTWDEYLYDPRDPVPTIGPGGAQDQRHGGKPLAARRDVLVFQTPPLEQGIEVNGPVTATLWVASDCPDTDFTIKLIDVHPPSAEHPGGFATNVTDGILSMRHRVSRERPTPITPGGVYEIAIAAPPARNLFARGHRVRLDVSSSNAPRFPVNPNTGTGEGTPRVATNRLYLDRARPSHVVLPISTGAPR